MAKLQVRCCRRKELVHLSVEHWSAESTSTEVGRPQHGRRADLMGSLQEAACQLLWGHLCLHLVHSQEHTWDNFWQDWKPCEHNQMESWQSRWWRQFWFNACSWLQRWINSHLQRQIRNPSGQTRRLRPRVSTSNTVILTSKVSQAHRF